MAHKGRKYPVDFRRDWNRNADISITSPNPDRWHVVLHSGVTPPYPIDGSVFVCLPVGFTPPDEIVWRSAVQSIGGFQWWLDAHDQFIALPDANRVALWQLHRLDKDLVAAWHPRLPDRSDPWRFISTEANTIFTDTTVFPRGQFFYNSSTSPVGY